jgi:hypothetical protein
VAVEGESDRWYAERLLTDEFTALLAAQPYGRRGADATLFEVRGGKLCACTLGEMSSAEALDDFWERADRIATEAARAARLIIQ